MLVLVFYLILVTGECFLASCLNRWVLHCYTIMNRSNQGKLFLVFFLANFIHALFFENQSGCFSLRFFLRLTCPYFVRNTFLLNNSQPHLVSQPHFFFLFYVFKPPFCFKVVWGCIKWPYKIGSVHTSIHLSVLTFSQNLIN